MKRAIVSSAIACALWTGIATAEPFQEVTVGVPVASVAKAEVWYLNLLGSDVEILRPFPGVVEFKVAPTVWLQIFEMDSDETAAPVVRFLAGDMAATQQAHAEAGIDSGEAIEVPGVVIYSEFADPDGNSLGLYALP